MVKLFVVFLLGLFRFFDFGFLRLVDVDAVRVDVNGELIFDCFNVFDEEVFEDNRETDVDKEGGENNFPSDVPAEDVLRGEEHDDAEGEHEEAAEFEPFRAKADEAWDDDEESPPAVKE